MKDAKEVVKIANKLIILFPSLREDQCHVISLVISKGGLLTCCLCNINLRSHESDVR